jgi:hypothetical protein
LKFPLGSNRVLRLQWSWTWNRWRWGYHSSLWGAHSLGSIFPLADSCKWKRFSALDQ